MSSELFVNRILLPLLVWALICLPLLWIILVAREHIRKQQEVTPEFLDDFAEFYLDLHRFATDADFTRAEAERLYRVWQRWMGERAASVTLHTNKEE